MANAKPKPQKNYRQMSEQLDEILAWFESENVDLDEALGKYEQALQLIDEMQNYLETAENKVRKITAVRTKK